MSIETPQCNCPSCGCKLDAATNLADERRRPSPGDLSVCINCTSFLVFDDNLILRNLSPEETKQLPVGVQDELWRIRRAAHKTDRSKVSA